MPGRELVDQGPRVLPAEGAPLEAGGGAASVTSLGAVPAQLNCCCASRAGASCSISIDKHWRPAEQRNTCIRNE